MPNLFLFFLVAVFWGGSFIAIKYAINSIDPVAAAMWRSIVAIVFLGIVAKLAGKKLSLPRKHICKVYLTGIFAIGLPFAFLFWGEKSISAGLAGIINGTVPIWTFILGLFFLKSFESFTPKRFFGIILGLAGVVLIFFPAVRTDSSIWGAVSVLLMAVSYAISGVMNKHLLSGKDKIGVFVTVFHQLLSAFLFLALLCLLFGKAQKLIPFDATLSAVAGCIYLGVFSTGFAWLIFYRLIKEWGAVRASTITYVVPIMAVLFDIIFFRSHPKPAEFAGMLVIFSSIALIQSK